MASEQPPTRKLAWLRVLLSGLPSKLDAPKKGEFTRYPFATFRPDQAYLERTEDEVGAINESFKSIFGWRTRTTGDGVLNIEERGKHGIGAVADLLEGYLKQYKDKDGNPNAILVNKWETRRKENPLQRRPSSLFSRCPIAATISITRSKRYRSFPSFKKYLS